MGVHQLLSWMLLIVFLTGVNTPSATPTPQPVRSIFAGDPCAPPCWFGITPGESSAADVERILEDNAERVFSWIAESDSSRSDVQEPQLEDGYYTVYWQGDSGEREAQSRGHVFIRDGVVYAIGAIVLEPTTLSEVINTLGQPETILFHGGQVPILNLHYSRQRLRVTLSSEEPDQCRVDDLDTNFKVDTFVYYASDVTEEMNRITGMLVREVPVAIWEDWLTSTVDLSCDEAFASLDS